MGVMKNLGMLSRAKRKRGPGVDVTIELDDAQLRALAFRMLSLPGKIQKNVIGQALARGAAPIIKAARALVPVRFGLLKRSLGVKRRSYTGGATQMAIIGARSEIRTAKDWPVKYSHLVELGTKPHSIKLGKALELNGVPLPAGTVIHHPGAKPKPFLRPAIQGQAQAALTAARAYLLAGVEREAAKLGTGT